MGYLGDCGGVSRRGVLDTLGVPEERLLRELLVRRRHLCAMGNDCFGDCGAASDTLVLGQGQLSELWGPMLAAPCWEAERSGRFVLVKGPIAENLKDE